MRGEERREQDRDRRGIERVGGHRIAARRLQLADDEQRRRDDDADEHAHRRLQPALLDRVAQEEDGREHERDAGDRGEQLHADGRGGWFWGAGGGGGGPGGGGGGGGRGAAVAGHGRRSRRACVEAGGADGGTAVEGAARPAADWWRGGFGAAEEGATTGGGGTARGGAAAGTERAEGPGPVGRPRLQLPVREATSGACGRAPAAVFSCVTWAVSRPSTSFCSPTACSSSMRRVRVL